MRSCAGWYTEALVSMADNKLIFQCKWLCWIFHRLFLGPGLNSVASLALSFPFPGRWQVLLFLISGKRPCPPHAGSLVPVKMLLKSHFANMLGYEVFPLLPMVRYLPLLQRGRERLSEYAMRTALRHRGRGPISVRLL